MWNIRVIQTGIEASVHSTRCAGVQEPTVLGNADSPITVMSHSCMLICPWDACSNSNQQIAAFSYVC